MKAAIFSARDTTKVYRSGEVDVFALHGVSLDLFEGEMVVLLGPSGSGKCTLLNIVGGLDHATSGTIRFRNEELTAFSERQLTSYRRDHMGFGRKPNFLRRGAARSGVGIAESELPRAQTALRLA
ncbi:ABC transporter related protein [Mesorhizobium alhagi CCNWXJ12-2]|uniref:ABC transporter related protein n=1 Tax=Mesorhizobium alhagi CCNWXJ12-2 TaxID=1107882 RepID=H0I1A4_9HYPH|nr:ABC transporter related protein [Mesorhizobium alhagi CCNWXJ12-2]